MEANEVLLKIRELKSKIKPILEGEECIFILGVLSTLRLEVLHEIYGKEHLLQELEKCHETDKECIFIQDFMDKHG